MKKKKLVYKYNSGGFYIYHSRSKYYKKRNHTKNISKATDFSKFNIDLSEKQKDLERKFLMNPYDKGKFLWYEMTYNIQTREIKNDK